MSETRLKILILARYASRRGGADVYTEGLAIQLAKRGHQVVVMCHEASQRVRDVCDVIDVSEPNFGQQRAVWRLAPLLYQRHWRRVLSNNSTTDPDVAVCSLPLSSHALQNRFPNMPWVYLPHSRLAPVEVADIESRSRVQRNVARRLYSRNERWSLLNARTTVRFTANNVRELRSYYDLPATATFDIIPAPVEEFATQPRAVIDGTPHFVSACRLVDSKNLVWLLNALAELPMRNWRWSIAGDGPQRVQLQLLAEKLGVKDNVSFLGFCENMADFYRTADLHLFPSRRESLGLVILEAMAFGIPTLAFRPDDEQFQTASDEVIEHNVDGWLAAGEQAYRDRLAHCLADWSELRPMGEAGRQKVLADHRWESVADTWERLLKQLTHPVASPQNRRVVHV